MDLKQLRYFVSVAERLSFTEAAMEHFVAQSAISKQISNLEEQTGVQLFIRNRRTVQLTNAGTQLLKDAKSVIASYEEAISNARLAGNGLSGNLKIGYLGLEKIFLPKLISQFTKKYPDVNIELIQYTRDTLNSSLKIGEIDIGFTLSLSIEKFPEIISKKIANIPFNVVLHSEHPLADFKKLSFSSIASEPIIVMNHEISPDGFQHISELFKKQGLSPNIVREGSHFETVLLMIEAGIGISILPKAISNPPSTLRFIELEEKIDEIDFIIAWNRNNCNPFISLFTKEFESFMNNQEVGLIFT
ncbi:LysR family transcriptional regulator [Bacillus sp. USDA818B3_A]|uniref:LysR family transcriptional regulator n=1 Tax=Bacillus sp. USDA818B3_A TaxID=2698834 RepID=UPI00136F94AB|nr:LysR family transcriptional regulator [Bacillus sp. USDA818B3_A]